MDRGNQYFKGELLFHVKFEIFVPGGTYISGGNIYFGGPQLLRDNKTGSREGSSVVSYAYT